MNRSERLGEAAILGEFAARVEELRRCRIVRGEALQAALRFEGGRQGLQILVPNPDEDDLRSFLVTFRKFVSDQEPVHLGRVFNAAQRCVTSDLLRDALISARAEWKQALDGRGIRVIDEGRALTPETVLDLWINGHYFHNDTRKAKALDRLGIPVVSRFIFLNVLVDTTNVIFYAGDAVRAALREGCIVGA
jgi:hypothetical protein